MAASDAKAAYEAVATQLKTPQLTTTVDAFELPYTVAPRLRVDTMPKVLAWPLAVHEVDQLAVAYTHSPGVVLLPAMSARVDNTNAWRKTLARVETIVWDVLRPTSPFRLALAHVAFDATGSSACLTPASRLPHTIGTVVISLPTFHRGGNVTFAGGRHRSYCTQHATTTHVCAVFAPNANYLIAPMTYGRRVTLVYHVVALDDPAETALKAATTTLQSLAAAPSHALNVLALRLTTPIASLCFENLASDDRAFADALIATEVYDVVLFEHAKYEAVHGGQMQAATIAMRLPDRISKNVCHMTVDAILFSNRRVDARRMQGQWLIYWRKSFRVQLVDAASVVETLVAAVAPGAVHSIETLLGQSDLRSLLRSLLLKTTDDNAGHGAELTNALCDALHHVGDRDLVVRFLSRHWNQVVLAPTAKWLPRFCAAFGWEYLGPAFLCMLRRWCATSTGFSASYELVTSLAGVSHRPICEPVSQPFVAELYLDARALLLDAVAERDDNTETTDTMFFHNCTRGLQLEAYAQQHALQGRWLYNRLPDAVVALVSSYLKPRVSMLRLLERKIYDPLFVVGVAIVDVKAQGLALNDYWYAAVVVQSFLVGEYDYDDVRYNVQTVMGLLAAGARTGHLDAVLTQCIVDRELVVVPALVAVAHRCPSLATPAFIASASSVILTTIVRNESALPSMDAMLRAYFASLPTHRGHGPRTCVVASAFEFIRTHDRANLGGFTDKWLASRPSTTLLYDAIVLLQSTLGLIESDVLVRLGMAYLTATSYRESDVVYADYCLHAIAVPEACCSSCGDFGRFLLAPLEVEHRFCVEHLCASIMAVVSAHPLQLRTHEHSVLEFGDVTMWGNAVGYTAAAPTPVVDILKVRQPGQLLPSDLRRCLKQSKTTSTSTVYRRGVVDELMTRLKAATMREESSAATAE